MASNIQELKEINNKLTKIEEDLEKIPSRKKQRIETLGTLLTAVGLSLLSVNLQTNSLTTFNFAVNMMVVAFGLLSFAFSDHFEKFKWF